MVDALYTELPVAGPAAAALRALSSDQLGFLQRLPKAELHAHLNGSIPLPVLQDLARERLTSTAPDAADSLVADGIARLYAGVTLDAINDFFSLFPAIYALTSNPDALRRAARAVLSHFLDGSTPQASYLELRTTPRATVHMSRRVYLEAVLAELEAYPSSRASLLVSLDRRMDADTAREVVALAIQLKSEGRRVVGVDLCGDPLAGDMAAFQDYFRMAHEAGLGVTLHIAETDKNPAADTLQLLEFSPDRLGHATFLDETAQQTVRKRKTAIEICLSSNLLCKTVPHLADHHIRHYLQDNHPIAICTDDILPFRTSLIGEYALLLAPVPLGLGLTQAEVEAIARMGMECRFGKTA